MAIVCVIRIECRSGFEEMKAIEFQNRSASWRGGELKEAPVVLAEAVSSTSSVAALAQPRATDGGWPCPSFRLDLKAAREGIEAIAPLYGLPIPMKGTMATVDFISSAGVSLLHDFRAKDDADFVAGMKTGKG
ncbi:unnamed protein product [Cladocopium goreaui]|uniref:Glutamyl-tRNA(Gln) amidotransferase subunit A n=1 Tax=Cladocopium goreaui TaxID=2562237 RepID=A0A9P1CD01_9DINO|nr:unnamed protein product [Cladocopium goreaui]